MTRGALLPFAFGLAIALTAVATYWGLEALLASYADHDRGLWEGAAVMVVAIAGNVLANRVIRRVDARKKEAA